jgi:hypothetical protein
MPRLQITITKRTDGGYVIACRRADGSVTWQKGASAAFFPVHDLTHYAVETELGHRRGFYGLVADGWDFDDFGAPDKKGKLPADMDPSELIVGFLDAERVPGGRPMTADELNASAARYFQQHGHGQSPGAPVVAVTQAQLWSIRQKIQSLKQQWEALSPGGALTLEFG